MQPDAPPGPTSPPRSSPISKVPSNSVNLPRTLAMPMCLTANPPPPPPYAAASSSALAGSSTRRGISVSRAITRRWICEVPS